MTFREDMALQYSYFPTDNDCCIMDPGNASASAGRWPVPGELLRDGEGGKEKDGLGMEPGDEDGILLMIS